MSARGGRGSVRACIGTRLARRLGLLIKFPLTITRLCQLHYLPKSACAKAAKRRLKNRVTKKVIKTASKRATASLAAKDLDKAADDIKAAASKIDKAGARRVLHPNTAARRKSKLARAYAAALAKSQQA